MHVISDLPSVSDLEFLEQALAADHLDRGELAEILDHIGRRLYKHAEELDEMGGPLTKDEEAARPSLARQSRRLSRDVLALAAQSTELTEQVELEGERTVRQDVQEFFDSLRRLRDQEADVKLESVVTDIGAGD